MGDLDVGFCRSHFPALKSFVFMDNAGGSQVNRLSIDAIQDYLATTSVQLCSTYKPAREGLKKLTAALEACQRLVNARAVEEIVMGPSATQLFCNLALGLEQRQFLTATDEVIVTQADHESNITPWRRIAERARATVKEWPIDQASMSLQLADVEALLSSATRLVCFTHCSNILGRIVPVKEAVRAIRQRAPRALIVVDGVSFAPHRVVDVQDLDVDFYALSLYKVYGPRVSLLYGKYTAMRDLVGNVNHYFLEKEVPLKLQPGGVNFELVVACTGVLEYFGRVACRLQDISAHYGVTRKELALVSSAFARQEKSLCRVVLSFLKRVKEARIIGVSEWDSEVRVPTISFVVGGIKSQDIAEAMDGCGIGVRFGHFYAVRLMEAVGLVPADGVVRVSMVHYNTVREAEKLVKCLESYLIGKGASVSPLSKV